ncbi:MAG TPA: hypothetical protein VG325_05055 [Solirubrobacteraceae bacterium]|nr:hypothetical protein [Solirubrobacteraceae bacterium]
MVELDHPLNTAKPLEDSWRPLLDESGDGRDRPGVRATCWC